VLRRLDNFFKGMAVDVDTRHGIHFIRPVVGCLCNGNPVESPTALF
jgi:hypothetical protein